MKKLLCLLISFGLMFSVYPTQWQEGIGENTILGTISPSDIDKDSYENAIDPLDRMLTNFREGCKIAYTSASTITVAAGEIMLSNSDASIKLMQQNTSATTVTWSDIDTGAEASSTTYYLWAFQATTTDTDFDVTISKSSIAPTGKTYYARLGDFYNNSSSNIERMKNDNTYMVIVTGTVVNGGTIPLPYGYAESQCRWMVSVNDGDYSGEASGGADILSSGTRCSVNSSRVVSLSFYAWNYGWGNTGTSVANYLIIGYK